MLIRYDYNSVSDGYSIAITKSFEALLMNEEEKTPDELWSDGKKALLASAKDNFSRKKQKKTQWISNDTLKEVKERRKLKPLRQDSRVDEENFRNQHRKVQRLMRMDKNRYINEQCALIEQNSITNTTKDLYQGVKNLTRKFKAHVDTIKDKEGFIICEGEKYESNGKNIAKI